MLKRPNKQRFFQRWLIANVCVLAQTITMIGLGAFMILEGNWQNVLLFFSAIFLVPFIVLVAIYGFRATLNREKWESVIYPGVDFVRVLAFMTGEFCGFIMKT